MPGSIRPSLASLFRWGSVPGSPSEVRAYLQRRMTMYLGLVASIWGAAWIRLGQSIPASLEAVVLTCLEKAPANRPKDAAALLALLDACDDIPSWTPDDARRWWAERGQAPRTSPPSQSDRPPLGLTLEVAMDRRAPEQGA